MDGCGQILTMVKLKNGSSSVRSFVALTMKVLDQLFTTDPIAFYELCQKARDANHVFWNESTKRKLEHLGLLDGQGHVQNAVRDVVLSATSGEGLDLAFGSPYASE